MNSSKLKAKLIINRTKVDDFLKKMQEKGVKMSKNSYYRRLNGSTEFNRKEITAIVDILELSQEEMVDIFFEDQVS